MNLMSRHRPVFLLETVHGSETLYYKRYETDAPPSMACERCQQGVIPLFQGGIHPGCCKSLWSHGHEQNMSLMREELL